MVALEGELDRRRHQRGAVERDREARARIAGLNPPSIHSDGVYSDGVVTIRPQHPDDLEADLAAKDEEQIKWLSLPAQREQWQAMMRDEQRAHAARTLAANRDAFGAGPKWCFAVDSTDARYVAYVDFDLANEHVPPGDANISYSSHPTYRGRGYVVHAVRLVTQFIAENTHARRAYLIIDSDNIASLRVARAVGAAEVGRWIDGRGRTMIRHELRLRRSN